MYRNGNHEEGFSAREEAQGLGLRVLSAFEEPDLAQQTGLADVHPSPGVHRSSRKGLKITASLSCTSKPEGKSGIDDAVDAVLNGEIGASELAQAYFYADGIDDVEAIPPLCNFSVLAWKGLIRLADVNRTGLRTRAVYEMAQNNACTCFATDAKSGVQKAFSYVLGSGRSQARDAILDELLAGLLSPSHLSISDTRSSLTIVKVFLNCATDVLDERDLAALLLRWGRESVLLPGAREARGGAADDNSSVWSTELSGLAVGNRVSDFLHNGKLEEQALDALFEGMTSTALKSLMSDAMGIILGKPSSRSGGVAWPSGQFSRICSLVRKVGSLESKESAGAQPVETAHQFLEHMFSSAICSPQLAGDGRKLAMVITLARVFFHGMHVLTLTNVTNSVRLYERWFLSILKTAPKPSVKFLLEVLQELIPLEPLAYLRCQIKCFRRVPSWSHLSEEYVIIARTRSKDIDPSGHAGGDSNRSNGTSEGIAHAAVQDVCKFVVEFHRAEGKKVPPSLVRQMNFHRHHFRNNTLDTMLMPDMNPPQEVIDSEFARGGVEAFDLKRVALIKVLAYERKDRAITKDEADIAIPKIHAAIKNRRVSLFSNPKGVLTRVEPVKKLSEDSSIFDVLEEFCNASVPNLVFEEESGEKTSLVIDVDAPSLENGGEVSSNVELARWKKADRLLSDKLIQYTNVAEGAAEMLQMIADRVNICSARCIDKEVISDDAQDRTHFLNLWQASEPWLRTLLTRTFSRKRQKEFWETLKLHVVGSLCVQTRKLSVKQILGIAIFVFAIVKFSESTERAALAFLFSKDPGRLVHLGNTIAESLPLDSCEHVQNSVQFAVCYLMLVLANSQELTVRHFPDHDDHPSTSRSSTFLPAELVGVVQWVLCAPWRLHKSRASVVSGGMAGRSAHHVVSIVKGALSVTKALEVFRCKEFSLSNWVRGEIRSGWGSAQEVVRVLNKFSHANGSSLAVIVDTACEIAFHCANGSPFPDWIVLGLSTFSEDFPVQRGESKGLNSLSHSVDAMFREHGARAGCLMVDILEHASPSLYFKNASVTHIYSHVQQTLSPSFWPFSPRLIKFLLRAISENENPTSTDSHGDQFLPANPPPSLVSSTAAFLAAAASADVRVVLPESPPWAALVQQAQSLQRTLSRLSAYPAAAAGNPDGFATQALGSQSQATQGGGGSQPSAGRTKLRRGGARARRPPPPEALALGVLCLAARGDVAGLWGGGGVEQLCGALGPAPAAEVLDAAADAAAQLPVARARGARAGVCVATERWCAPALAELLRLRAQLALAHPPFWARGACAPDATPFAVARVRAELGLVPACAPAPRPPKRARPGDARRRCAGAHAIWQARVAAALARLDDEAFAEATAQATQGFSPLRALACALRAVRSADIRALSAALGGMRHAPGSEHAVGVLLGALDAALCKGVVRAAAAEGPAPQDVWEILQRFAPHLLGQVRAPVRGGWPGT